jgi:hypothetical protein
MPDRMLFCCLLAVTAIALAGDERAPTQYDVTLSPERLTCTGRGSISLACTVSNRSQSDLNVVLDSADVFLWPNLIVVETYGWKTAKLKRITLKPGESRQFPVEVQLDRDVPALDAGQYQLHVDLCVETEGAASYIQRSANVIVRQIKREDNDRDVRPFHTVQAILSAAKEYSMQDAGNSQIVDYDSYRIRRDRRDWVVSFSYRGPKAFGTRDVYVNAVTNEPYFMCIP